MKMTCVQRKKQKIKTNKKQTTFKHGITEWTWKRAHAVSLMAQPSTPGCSWISVSSLDVIQADSLLHDVPIAIFSQNHHHSAVFGDVLHARSFEHELRGRRFAKKLPVVEDHSVGVVTKLNDTKATVGLDVQSAGQEDVQGSNGVVSGIEGKVCVPGCLHGSFFVLQSMCVRFYGHVCVCNVKRRLLWTCVCAMWGIDFYGHVCMQREV